MFIRHSILLGNLIGIKPIVSNTQYGKFWLNVLLFLLCQTLSSSKELAHTTDCCYFKLLFYSCKQLKVNITHIYSFSISELYCIVQVTVPTPCKHYKSSMIRQGSRTTSRFKTFTRWQDKHTGQHNLFPQKLRLLTTSMYFKISTTSRDCFWILISYIV